MQVIEELAEWIDHAFCAYEATVPDVRQKGALQAPKAPEMHASPLTSETETDDTGITFIPRRQAATPPHGRRTSFGGKAGGSDEERSGGGPGTGGERAAATTPPRQTGQTISESELMRRRRLLDAHIFK